MERQHPIGMAFVSLALAAPVASAEVRIEHDAPRCVIAERFPVLQARFEPSADVQRAKVYFRGAGSAHWYSVAMRAEGTGHAAVLPRPKKSLKSFTYYIEAVDRAAAVVRTAEATPDVVGGTGGCRGGTIASGLGTAAVILETPAGAPVAVPAGFSASGVTATAGAAAAATAAGVGAGVAAATATGGGVSGTVLVVGGLAAAGATAAVVATRDGGGGPCTEGGGFEFAVESSLEGGNWGCVPSPAPTLVIRVRNNSCQKMEFGSGSHRRVETRSSGGTNVTPESGFTLDDVDAGGELVHREPQPAFIACRSAQGGPSLPGADRRAVEWTFSIPSNLGPASDVVHFSFDFADCPRCPF